MSPLAPEPAPLDISLNMVGGRPMQSRTIADWFDDVVGWLATCDRENLVRRFRLTRGSGPANLRVQEWDLGMATAVADMIVEICQKPDYRFVLSRVLFAGQHTSRLWDPESLARWISVQAGEYAMGVVAEAALIAAEAPSNEQPEPDFHGSPDSGDDPGRPGPPVDNDPGDGPEDVHDVPDPDQGPGQLDPPVPEAGSGDLKRIAATTSPTANAVGGLPDGSGPPTGQEAVELREDSRPTTMTRKRKPGTRGKTT